MRNLSDRSHIRGNQNTYFVSSNCFFENLAVYEKMRKNIVKLDRPQMKICHMRIACWIP